MRAILPPSNGSMQESIQRNLILYLPLRRWQCAFLVRMVGGNLRRSNSAHIVPTQQRPANKHSPRVCTQLHHHRISSAHPPTPSPCIQPTHILRSKFRKQKTHIRAATRVLQTCSPVRRLCPPNHTFTLLFPTTPYLCSPKCNRLTL
jgi:hypothetical protein